MACGKLPGGCARSRSDSVGCYPGASRGRRASVARTDGCARLDGADVAAPVRRRRADAARNISCCSKSCGASMRARRLTGRGRQLHRPDVARLRHAGAEGALASRHRARRRRLVYGVLRTGRRLRPRESEHPRRARRRSLRHQRPQDVDVGCDGVRLHLRARPHRPGCAEARRHQPDADRHESERRAGAADPADQRQFAVQRNVVRKRRGAPRRCRWAAEPGLDRRQTAVAVRALDACRHQHLGNAGARCGNAPVRNRQARMSANATVVLPTTTSAPQ